MISSLEIAVLLCFISALGALLMAAAVAFNAGRSFSRWLFSIGLTILAVESICSALSIDGILVEEKVSWQISRLVALSFFPGIWMVFSLVYARGDASQRLARHGRWFLGLGLMPVLLVIGYRHELLSSVGHLKTDGTWMLGLGLPGIILYSLVLIACIFALMNLERTYRASIGTLRWRIKFLLLGLGLLLIARAYTAAQVLTFQAISMQLHAVDSGALLLACLLMLRTLLRTGHFDVSVYPSEAVLKSSVSVLLAGVYLVIIGGSAKLLSFFPDILTFEVRAFLALIALVILGILMMSDRVRLQIHRFISRHFHRPIHHYPQVWRRFAAETTGRLDPVSLCEGIARAVSNVFEALSVTVWLVDETQGRLIFAASTSLLKSKAESMGLAAKEFAAVTAALRRDPQPVDLDRSMAAWAVALRALQPEEFRETGHRVCVPMIAGGDLLGVILVGDRVSALPYQDQDLELLKVVAEQAAASLLNLQLGEKLSQAKQLEAFQAMAAFFVHDLKNTTSILSLMLRNLPVHFDDPEFRAEALADIARIARQLEDHVGRLNMLRQEFKISAADCDLNQVVSETLHGHEWTGGVQLLEQLQPLPSLRLDPAQIRTVITNLVLNAREAVGSQGRIRVETGRQDGWAVLAVSDDGCGMAPEFIKNCLFKPFQTTKKNGIGIGMFHCRMIVEAHRGRIDVESQQDKGTTFRVLLPVPS